MGMTIDHISQPGRTPRKPRGFSSLGTCLGQVVSGNERFIESFGKFTCGTVSHRPQGADEDTRSFPDKRLGNTADARQAVSGPPELAGVQHNEWTPTILNEIRVSLRGRCTEVSRDVLAVFDASLKDELRVDDVVLLSGTVTGEMQ